MFLQRTRTVWSSKLGLVLAICCAWCPVDNILSAAQQTPSEDRPVIQISADKSSFYSLQDTSIVRRPIRDNIRIPIDRIRFLSLESVRNELKLSGSTKKSLKPLVRLVIRFDRQDKWNFYSSTTEVSAIAKSNVKEFAEEIEKVVKEQLISESQMEHLDQVRLRFNCLGLDRADPEFSPIKKVISELGLTADQRNAIREIFADELSDLLSLRKQFDSIFQVLDESQRLEIEQVFQPFLELTTPVGLSLAQCQDIRSIEEIENKFESEFDLELLDRVVLTPSGQLEIESVFVEGGEGVFMPRPWAQIRKPRG